MTEIITSWFANLLVDVTSQDLFLIGVLIFLEGILSVDNALVLAVLAKHLPKDKQKKALTYGLVGAMVFRFIALIFATRLMEANWVKFVGGGYLIYLAVKNLVFGEKQEDVPGKVLHAGFWKTVLLIELTDIAFAVDSILAAVALTNKLWVVYTGGIIGIIVMRFAATQFIKVLEKFPQLEKTAYMLVLVIGLKVVIEGFRIPGIDFHSPKEWAFWTFWGIMAICIAYGFIVKPKPVPDIPADPQ